MKDSKQPPALHKQKTKQLSRARMCWEAKSAHFSGLYTGSPSRPPQEPLTPFGVSAPACYGLREIVLPDT